MAISSLLIFRYCKAKVKNFFSKESVVAISDAFSTPFSKLDSSTPNTLMFGLKPRQVTSSAIIAILLPNSREKRLAAYISLSLIFIFVAFILHFTFIVVGLGLAYQSYIFSFHPQLLNITDLYSFSSPVRFEADATSISFVDILFNKFTVEVFAPNDTYLELPLISHTLNNLYFYGNRRENHISCDINCDISDRFPFIDFSRNIEFLVKYSFRWDLSCAWIPISISHFVVMKEVLYDPSDTFIIEKDSENEIVLVTRDPPPEAEFESSGSWSFLPSNYSLLFLANQESYDAQFGPFILESVIIYGQGSSIAFAFSLLFKHELEYLSLLYPESEFVISVQSYNASIYDQLVGFGKLEPINIDPRDRPSRVRFTIDLPFEPINTDHFPALNLSDVEFESFLNSSRTHNQESVAEEHNTYINNIHNTPRKVKSILQTYLSKSSPILINILFRNVTTSKFEQWFNRKGGIRLKFKGCSAVTMSFRIYLSLVIILGHLFNYYITTGVRHFILILKHILKV